MKNVIHLFMVLCMVLSTMSFASCGVKRVQNVPQIALSIDTVIQTSLSQKIAYQKAAAWVATSYNSAQDVVQLSDSESATIIGKGVFNHSYGSSMKHGSVWGLIHYTLTIRCKDNRIRVTIQDFRHEAQTKTTISKDLGLVNTGAHPEWGHVKFISEYWSDLQRYCQEYSHVLIQNLLSDLENKEDDNW